MLQKKGKSKLGIGLQSILNFTDEDLLANRQGFLSERQIQLLAAPTGSVPIIKPTHWERFSDSYMLVMAGLLSIIGGVVLFLVTDILATLCLAGIGVFFIAAVVQTLRFENRYLQRIMGRKQKVLSLKGTPGFGTAQRQGEIYPALIVRRYKLIIQQQDVLLVKDFFEKTGKYPFVFYYWKPSRRVLSAEPVSMDADYYFENLPLESDELAVSD